MSYFSCPAVPASRTLYSSNKEANPYGDQDTPTYILLVHWLGLKWAGPTPMWPLTLGVNLAVIFWLLSLIVYPGVQGRATPYALTEVMYNKVTCCDILDLTEGKGTEEGNNSTGKNKTEVR